MGKVKSVAELHTELYDLEGDIGEARDVSAENPEVIGKIEKVMRDARTPSELFPMKPLDGK